MRDRLVFLHGFTQTHFHWHRCADLVANMLGSEPTSAFVDLPGHGLSGDDRTGIADTGQLLVAIGGQGTWIGYSMGARFALASAVTGTELIVRLVLISGTPGIIDEKERSQRRAADESLADRVEQIGTTSFIDEWLAGPLFTSLPHDPDDRQRRVGNTAAGLAASLRKAGTGVQRPIWDALERIAVPTLVLAGDRDTKFVEIGERMAGTLSHGTFRSIAEAGHAAHIEQPYTTAQLIATWIEATPVT